VRPHRHGSSARARSATARRGRGAGKRGAVAAAAARGPARDVVQLALQPRRGAAHARAQRGKGVAARSGRPLAHRRRRRSQLAESARRRRRPSRGGARGLADARGGGGGGGALAGQRGTLRCALLPCRLPRRALLHRLWYGAGRQVGGRAAYIGKQAAVRDEESDSQVTDIGTITST
jgi:hypothetical protein